MMSSGLYQSYNSHFKYCEANKDHYEKWFTPIHHRFRHWFKENNGEVVYDLGCGNGSLVYSLTKMGYDAKGVDLSFEQVQLAQSLHLPVEQGEVQEWLSNQKQGASLITCFDILEHLPLSDNMELLKLIHHQLKTNGTLIIQVPNAIAPNGGNIQFGDLTHITAFAPDSMTHLLKASGFEVLSVVEAGPTPHNFSGILRTFLWKGLKKIYEFCDLVECGAKRKAYTRVFAIVATKK